MHVGDTALPAYECPVAGTEVVKLSPYSQLNIIRPSDVHDALFITDSVNVCLCVSGTRVSVFLIFYQ